MIKVGENGIFLSDAEARKLSPYMLEKLKKTLVISLQAIQETPPTFVETDPIYSSSSWFSTTNNSTDWDTAFSWGNHSSAGYALTTSLAAVATSGSYSDLSGTPLIPTQVSQLTNDIGYITSSALSSYLTTTAAASTYQPILVSGTSIKTINGTSLLGSGDISVSSSPILTTGSIPFSNGSTLIEDNSNLFWDNTNKRLGIGLTSPSSPLHVSSTTSSVIGRFTTSGISNRLIIEASTGISGISFAQTGFGTRWGIGCVISTQSFVISKSGDLNGATNLAVEIGPSTRNIGIQLSGATAKIHIAAGTATAGSSPLKFTSGTNLATPEPGTVEYNNTFHLTNSDNIRRHIVLAPNTTKVTTGAPNTNDGYVIVNIGGIDFKLMTCL